MAWGSILPAVRIDNAASNVNKVFVTLRVCAFKPTGPAVPVSHQILCECGFSVSQGHTGVLSYLGTSVLGPWCFRISRDSDSGSGRFQNRTKIIFKMLAFERSYTRHVATGERYNTSVAA